MRDTLNKFGVLLTGRQRSQMLLVMTGMFLAALMEMLGIGAIPAFVALLADPSRLLEILPDGPLEEWFRSTDTATVTLYGAIALAGIFLVKNIYIAMLIYAESRVHREVTASVATRLFRAYMYSPYAFHLHHNPAQLIRNVSSEVTQAVNLMSSGVLVLREGLVLVVVFVLLLLMDPLVSLSTFALFGATAGAFYFSVRRALKRRGRLAQAHRGRQLQAIKQGLGAIKDAKILGRERFLVDVFTVEVAGIQRHTFFQKVIMAMPRLFLEVLGVLAIVLVAVVFVLLGRSVESMLPVLALLAVGTVRLVPAFNTITASLTQIRYQYPSLDLVAAELSSLEQDAKVGDRCRVHGESGPKLQSAIDIHELQYRYPGANTEALRGISVSIAAGQAVGFIGPSGAGKSTLVDVILGLLQPTAGEVRVDGRNIQDDLAAWQAQIGYVPQSIYLIDDTIRRNVAFGLPDEEIDDAAFTCAMAAAQLDIFVNTLPEGAETLVGDRGVRLSGGQRQRIGIARALYHNPGVLVMDEATSALDSETEREVVTAIGRLRGERTIIIIAHRMTTVRGCDCLFLLDDGCLRDQGTYSELALRHEQLRLDRAARR